MHLRRWQCWLIGMLLCLHAAVGLSAPIIDHWPVIAEAFYQDRPVPAADGKIVISAPAQAEDSALVPISIQFAEAHGIARWTLFVDANPIMLTLTTHMPDTTRAFALSTRIRLDANSKVRVVAEKPDGSLSMASVEIKTPGGGCGGAVSQDEAALRASAGNIKLRQVEEGRATVLQIQHPMRTGFERTVYGYYAKAWYLQKIEWLEAANNIMALQLGPGISANPYFKIDYPFDLATLAVQASDNENQQFSYPKQAVSAR